MKHQPYSKYRDGAWKTIKQFYPKRQITEELYSKIACEILALAGPYAQAEGDDPLWGCDSTYVDNIIFFLWRFRQLQHYFLAPGVAEFCESSVKEFSPDYCKALPSCERVPAPARFRPDETFVMRGSDAKVKDSTMQGGFAIHFPTSECERSVIVIPDCEVLAGWNPETNALFCTRYFFCASDGDNTLLMTKEQSEGDFWKQAHGSDSSTLWLARLIFGFSLYIDAFPDAVLPAGNDDVKRLRHYKGKRRTVKANEIVDEETRYGVSPHWRRGHFRILSSARFVNKRGQTVYVRGTFVKGKAFDVLDDAPAESDTESEQGEAG